MCLRSARAPLRPPRRLGPPPRCRRRSRRAPALAAQARAVEMPPPPGGERSCATAAVLPARRGERVRLWRAIRPGRRGGGRARKRAAVGRWGTARGEASNGCTAAATHRASCPVPCASLLARGVKASVQCPRVRVLYSQRRVAAACRPPPSVRAPSTAARERDTHATVRRHAQSHARTQHARKSQAAWLVPRQLPHPSRGVLAARREGASRLCAQQGSGDTHRAQGAMHLERVRIVRHRSVAAPHQGESLPSASGAMIIGHTRALLRSGAHRTTVAAACVAGSEQATAVARSQVPPA